jgi:enamine deaminase RidA (YjgF/YER057c/UK114 family)
MSMQGRREFFGSAAIGAVAAFFAAPAMAQTPARKRYIKRDASQANAYSQAVVTEGGRTLWLAGQTGYQDAAGKTLAGDIEAQTREVFSRLGKTLEEAGGKLSDMVTMTVFLTDVRHARRFLEVRKEIFGDNFPASAAITITALANPAALLEVQGVAVIG